MKRTAALSKTHRDGRGTGSSGCADADDLSDTVWIEPASGKTLHAAHRASDAGVEFIDAEMIEKVELGVDHVE
jgi:hypothetical protein